MNEENQIPTFAIKADLDGNQERKIQKGYYPVDFTKMSSVNDLVIILAAMGFTFHTSHPHFDMVKAFLDLDNPIKTEQETDKPEIKPFKKPEKQ